MKLECVHVILFEVRLLEDVQALLEVDVSWDEELGLAIFFESNPHGGGD